MKPYKKKVQIGDCTLYLGDCLEVMPTLDKVDCVVTYHPYLLTYGGCHGSLGGKLSNDNYDNKGGLVECKIQWDDFMPVIYSTLRDGHAYIMCNNRHVQNMLNSADRAKFKFHNLLVWDKISPTPNRWYMKSCEYTGFFFKGRAKFLNDCGSKQLIRIPLPIDDSHPTVKPVSLMEHYIENSTLRGEVALDPFMGSGTTLVACAKLGRKGIGIELDETYFEIACERIRKAYEQPDFFVTAPKHLIQDDFNYED